MTDAWCQGLLCLWEDRFARPHDGRDEGKAGGKRLKATSPTALFAMEALSVI